MGRGTIVSGGSNGLYSVRLDFGKAARDARVAAIDKKIEKLNIEIAKAEDAIVLAEARTQEAANTLKTVLDAMVAAQLIGDNAAVAALKPQADKATSQYAIVLAEEAGLRVPRDLQIAERKELVASKGRLLAARIEDTRQAWCLDYTEDAAGEVATVEIPGEDDAVLIAPGGRPPEAGDGQLMAREIMTPEQAFFNAAILPGWQKWMPTYRKATLTFVDEDLNIANVDLDPATSSANRLGVNQSTRLSGIPIEYMECNALAFTVGDRVVVGFSGMNWEDPRVIGFVENPKPCSWMGIGGSFVTAPSVHLECLEDGLVDQIFAGAVATCWLNGAGPYNMPLFSLLGTESPGFFWLVFGGSPGDAGTFNVIVRFYPPVPTSEPGATPPFAQPFGFVNLFVQPQEGGEQSVAEVVVRVGGLKKLHVAFTSVFQPPPPGQASAEIKGCPLRIRGDSSVAVTRLTDYTFVGS